MVRLMEGKRLRTAISSIIFFLKRSTSRYQSTSKKAFECRAKNLLKHERVAYNYLSALAPRKEVPALIPGTSNRPADVFLPIRKRGQPVALDVTVISTLKNLTVAGASSTQGHALSVARERYEKNKTVMVHCGISHFADI